jgi:hypothetical protein
MLPEVRLPGIREVRLLYSDGCPHWRTTHDRLRQALREEGIAYPEPILERVETAEDAERLGFTGSPTILGDQLGPVLAVHENHRNEPPAGGQRF